jgi:predicted transcriptional regulator of viral defense system
MLHSLAMQAPFAVYMITSHHSKCTRVHLCTSRIVEKQLRLAVAATLCIRQQLQI